MKKACANNNIGYDQSNRYSLYNEAKKYNFDVSKVTIPVETDCSALVRVCLAYAGINVSDFATSGEAKVIMDTGKFDKLDFTKESDLKNGDILVTKTSGHTAIVVSGNPRATKSPITSHYKKYTGTSQKIDEVFKSIGVPAKYRGSFTNRKAIANANGIKSYGGTMEQNLNLISLAKRGKLKKIK